MEQAVIYSPVGPLTLFAEDDFLTALVYGDYGGYDDIPLFREATASWTSILTASDRPSIFPCARRGQSFRKKCGRSSAASPTAR